MGGGQEQMVMVPISMLKGGQLAKGGGFGKGFGKGKKGKGKSLKSFDADCKVWIGDLAEGTTWKELQEHMNQGAEKTKWVEVLDGKGKGTGAVAYASAEAATTAIATLSGSTLKGSVIVCDVWEKKPKTA